MDDPMDPSEFTEPMPCYEFSSALLPPDDDGRCVHCRKFLTVECPYIDHFLSEDDE